MSKCELQIILDRPNRTYGGGETITGSVLVTASAACECRGLKISIGWRTSGKGNTDEVSGTEKSLFEGSWQAGQSSTYRFDFIAPQGPITYQYQLFKVEWFVSAHVDVAGEIDPNNEEMFTLLAGGHDASEAVQPNTQGLDEFHESWLEDDAEAEVGFGTGSTALWVFGCSFVITLASVCYLVNSLVHDAFGHEAERFLTVVCVVLGLAVACMLATFGNVWRQIALYKLGPVVASVVPKGIKPGECVTCKIHFRPRADAQLVEAKIEVVAVESSAKGSGKSKRTATHAAHQSNLVLAQDRALAPGGSLTLEGKIMIPSEAPPTFMGISNMLDWTAKFRLSLKNWPDWTQDFTLRVIPPESERGQTPGVTNAS